MAIWNGISEGLGVKYFSEDEVVRNLDEDTALEAARQVFRGLATGDAVAYRSVRNATGHRDALFGNKSGFDRQTKSLGLKAGGYWPHNETQGLPNHQSITILFDPDTGEPQAAMSGNHLTAMRTAAASALAIDLLARQDCRTLAIIGAGHQAVYQVRAAARVRSFDRLLIWNRTSARAEALAEACRALFDDTATPGLEESLAEADCVISVLSSFEPVIPTRPLRAGVHVCAMGSDTVGKREFQAGLFGRAKVFADDPEQAAELGEIQHGLESNEISLGSVIPLADVMARRHPGRTSDQDITVYDGTGMGLQDLVTAKAVLSRSGY